MAPECWSQVLEKSENVCEGYGCDAAIPLSLGNPYSPKATELEIVLPNVRQFFFFFSF